MSAASVQTWVPKCLMPEFMLEPELVSEDVPLVQPGASAEDPGFIFPEALIAPGVLHIVNNMTKEIDDKLPFWQTWIVGFRGIARLLYVDHLRRRLIGLCVKNTPYSWLEDSFAKGVKKPAEWRWATVSAIVPHLLSLRTALQAVWNPSLFENKHSREDDIQQKDENDDGEALNLDAITQAIRSSKWWLQTEAVYRLNACADEFSCWAEGCECHGFLFASNLAAPHMHKQSRRSPEAEELMLARCALGLPTAHGGDGVGHLCPLAGRRAPDLACGAAAQHFGLLGGASLHEIRRAALDLQAEPSDAAEVLEQVSQAQSAMQAYVCQKLQCWQVLPWRLCGIAHHNISTSRHCASECLRLFRESPQDPSLHHRVSWAHLREGARTRLELEQYIAGKALDDLCNLKKLVFELKFIPTVERLQEGDHGILNKVVNYRRISGPYVSCALRLPEIRNLTKDASQYQLFLQQFASVDDLDNMARLFSFHRHPQWQLMCHEKQSKKKKLILAGMIMYSMDIETQFATMTKVKKAREKRARERTERTKKWNARFEQQPGFSLAAIERNAMSEHLQSEVQVGRLYSVPQGSTAVRSLSTRLQPLHLQPAASASIAVEDRQPQVLALTSDVEPDPCMLPEVVQPLVHAEPQANQVHGQPEEADSAQHALFWRLTCARPGRHKLVRLPPASAHRLPPSDFTVTLHWCFEGPGSRYVEIEPAQSQGVEVPIAVLSVLKADIACVSKAMLCWSTTKEVSFTLTGCERVMSVTVMKVLKKLVQDNAFLPSTEHASGHSAATSFDAEELACLWTLTQLGFVCSLSDSEANANFVFTKLGAQSLRHVQQCTAPVRFFQISCRIGRYPAGCVVLLQPVGTAETVAG